MNYTKTREQLLSEIRVAAYSGVSRSLYNFTGQPLGSLDGAIKNAITDGIVDAFKVMMENTYTDQQFEDDLKLK